MTLKKFIKEFDKKGSTILLEGKREVYEADRQKLIALGRLLTKITKHILFRSGNASGADYFFSLGVSGVDKSRLQVITPYSGHREKYNQAEETISLEDINVAEEHKVIYLSKQNKKTENLIDKFILGDKNRYTIKAAYIIRDTIKAIGTENIKPAVFGIFYDDLKNPKSGGTGHTMKICEQNGIPFINQSVWFKWT